MRDESAHEHAEDIRTGSGVKAEPRSTGVSLLSEPLSLAIRLPYRWVEVQGTKTSAANL